MVAFALVYASTGLRYVSQPIVLFLYTGMATLLMLAAIGLFLRKEKSRTGAIVILSLSIMFSLIVDVVGMMNTTARTDPGWQGIVTIFAVGAIAYNAFFPIVCIVYLRRAKRANMFH